MIRTKLTEMLGIEYPIVQGCMQWISRAPLVAAVSEAGGLGLLSSSTFSSADELQAVCGASSTVMDQLAEIGALGDLPKSNQVSFF